MKGKKVGKKEKPNSGASEPTKRFNWITVLALLIAILGGVPGLFALRDYYYRSSIKIEFDGQQSVACRIKSNDHLKDKLSILLYNLTIVGKGIQPAYLRDINLAIKVDGNWLQGAKFFPAQANQTDKTGVTMKAVHLRLEKQTDHDDIFIAGWNDFVPGQSGIQYGQPSKYSVAAAFNMNEKAFSEATHLRLTITDYMGNEYKTSVEITPIMKQHFRSLYLLQDASFQKQDRESPPPKK
jgi:hypothetical protein